MDANLLKALFEEYEKLMNKENNYREKNETKEDGPFYGFPANRPTQTEVERIGILIRKETRRLERKFKNEYWG